ncbi:MAG: metallophosphoesterase [Planctomycetota bacterium]|nr:metallophosphoesterase [Planctomycetota bacterium]
MARKTKPSIDNSPTRAVPPQEFTAAVLSDLHAYSDAKPDDAPSHYCIKDPETDPSKNPIAGLKRLIDNHGLRADALVCPGDLAHQADPLALQQAWREVNELRSRLSASLLAPTSGNHDVDSRYVYNDHDAKGYLQTLSPPYPFPQSDLNDRYWSRHFVLLQHSPCSLLVLNSSALHGEGRYGDSKRYEFEHGRVSSYTLAAIERELVGVELNPVRVLLCHHHPHQHSELRLGADDLMAGGQQLLELLGSGRFGRWLVIHGHKHHPKLENAAGGAMSPVVFASGSLAATLFRELQTVARNQFYILTFPYPEYGAMGFVGRFRAWDWCVGQGWLPATERSGLPSEGGFGWRGDISVLANQLATIVDTGFVTWESLKVQRPELNYLLPQDISTLRQILEFQHSIKTLPPFGVPVQLGRTS